MNYSTISEALAIAGIVMAILALAIFVVLVTQPDIRAVVKPKGRPTIKGFIFVAVIRSSGTTFTETRYIEGRDILVCYQLFLDEIGPKNGDHFHVVLRDIWACTSKPSPKDVPNTIASLTHSGGEYM